MAVILLPLQRTLIHGLNHGRHHRRHVRHPAKHPPDALHRPRTDLSQRFDRRTHAPAPGPHYTWMEALPGIISAAIYFPIAVWKVQKLLGKGVLKIAYTKAVE